MTKAEIQARLRTKILGKEIHCFETIDSTNTCAKKMASEGEPEGTLIHAEEQTAGRGRFTRTWVSAPGENLTFSVILRPKISPEQTGLLSMYAAVSVVEAMKDIPGVSPACKWPNDILLNGRKCCGILSESIARQGMSPAIVIGIGLNVNQTKFPAELAGSATSIAIASGRSTDRTLLLTAILERMDTHYTMIQRGDLSSVLKTWKLYDTTIGKRITVNRNDGKLTGTAVRVDPDGGLIVSADGIESKVFSGDVSLSQEIGS